MTKTKKKKTVATQVIDARSVGTPLIAIETPDPSATNSELLETVKQTCAKAHVPVPPILLWDAASFLRALNEPALPVVDKLLEDFGGDPSAVGDPSQALALFNKTPEGTMIIMANVHRYWEGDHPDNRVIQHIFNLRNVFKSSGRTLIFTVPDCTLPSELKHDVMVLTAKLPTTEELKPMVIGMHDSAGWPKPSAEEVSVAVSALSGLAHQQAEQTIAMAIVDGKKEEKLNRDTLRMQQRQMIEQTEGLSIYQGSETFADLRGMDGLLGFCGKVIDGKNKPLAVVFVDEIEKMMAGALGGGSDTSGVSQEQCGYLLQHMQDTEAKGIMLLGLGGTGKSSVAKAFGNEAGCLTLGLDLGAMKGSLVGVSGRNMREALKRTHAVSQGRAFFIATSNNINAMPPELRRRFNYGTWYIDTPTDDAVRALLQLYGERYQVDVAKMKVSMAGWTGAEIKTCCMMAAEMNITVDEAAKFISPVYRSCAETLKGLRSLASGRFICAERGSFFQMPKSRQVVVGDEGFIEQNTRLMNAHIKES